VKTWHVKREKRKSVSKISPSNKQREIIIVKLFLKQLIMTAISMNGLSLESSSVQRQMQSRRFDGHYEKR